jgi:DUF4097 and DUF4098 domain-containing protein YvlB
MNLIKHTLKGQEMKTDFHAKASLVCLLGLLVLSASCCVNIGSCAMLAKYERIVQLSAPLQKGGTFAAITHNGFINVNGLETTECNLTATIVARAATEETARELAESTNIKLEPVGDKLTVKIEKPTRWPNQSISVSLDVTVPNHTNLQLTTHNGAVTIADIEGEIQATTHNGKIKTFQSSGSIMLHTHNGKVICDDIAGDVRLKTHNGGIDLCYSQIAESVCNISAVTHNGSIDFTAPPDLSAAVEVSTHNGSIRTKLPITVTGKVSKNKLTGTIGTGQGKLHLETHNGSIKIR